ncbi:nuclear transport factor 2 family protein [Stenotrophomonas sp. HITSZ_GD]|uniref:nuclear transport factor 2 family protein n=1 Tax=Stenotrophomonas sp. HITSZ_GD TaxID=3037248 RepID=UPI00240E794B|nr:nuclear transport factor 2 family protein [Stenotrophomonas sp. HITSZ_GD]MDG2524249.1 nuclear transport factor 2 family protein [Stenotrophomonas sp. HITSZ_GD]
MTPKHYTARTFLAFALLAASATPALANDASERNRQFIAQAFDEWAAGGSGFFERVLAPDMVWTIKGTSPVAGRYEGREEFMAKAVAPFAARLSSPMRPTVNHLWAEGDHVIVQWDGTAIAADGKPYQNSYVWILQMENLRAVEVTAFLDLVPYDDVIERIPLK